MIEFGEKVWSVFCANIPRSGYMGGCLALVETSSVDKEDAIKRWKRMADLPEGDMTVTELIKELSKVPEWDVEVGIYFEGGWTSIKEVHIASAYASTVK